MNLINEIRFLGDVFAATASVTYGFVRGAVHELLSIFDRRTP